MSEILHQKKKKFFAFQNACKRFCEVFFFYKKIEKMFAQKKIIEHIRC